MTIPASRPGRRQIALWVDANLLERIDAYKQSWHITRSSALAILVERGLRSIDRSGENKRSEDR